MKRHAFIKLNSAFLLIVFSLNTVVGFACSVELTKTVNSNHHANDKNFEPVVHIHKDGKRHIHYEDKSKHKHDKPHNSGHHKKEPDKNNCCTGTATKFNQLDKTIPSSFNIIHPDFLTAFVDSFYNIELLPHVNVVKDIKHFVRNYHPPIFSIRILIQSFQI